MDTATTGTLLVNTVDENKSRYTNRVYTRAVLARKIQKTMGRPSTRSIMKIVENNLLQNCPITREDIKAAEDTVGPDVGSMKGKTVHHAATHVDAQLVDIPASLIEQYRGVVMGGDIMFVNKIPFFITISH
jgi:hypothetical protein